MHLAPMLAGLAHKLGPRPMMNRPMIRRPMLHGPPVMDEDARMLCKVLDSTAAQALELKKRIIRGKKLPSWAEYKVYIGSNGIKSALSSTYSMSDHMPKISIMIKKPMMGGMIPSSVVKPALTKVAIKKDVAKAVWGRVAAAIRGSAKKSAKTVGKTPMSRRAFLGLMGQGATKVSPAARIARNAVLAAKARRGAQKLRAAQAAM